MNWDYFLLALRNLKKRGIRTWLTMLGIFIGIAAIVSLISLGQGLEHAITEQFEEMGADKITIAPGGLFSAPGSTGIEFTTDDEHVIQKTKGVELTAPMLFKIETVKSHDELIYTYTLGIEPDDLTDIYSGMSSFEIDQGRFLKKSDTYKVILGMRFGKEDDLFKEPIQLGDKIIIGGQDFDVVGILKTIGNPQDDANVIMPLETARKLWNDPDTIDYLIAQTKLGEDPAEVAERIKKNLRDHRDVDEGSEDFAVITTEQLLDSFGTILTVVQSILIGIAAISLLVGGIGIMNTMYTSVLERTGEIGVMKAIGATNSDILSIFLVEAGVLGTIGGLIGVAIGMLFSEAVSLIAVAATGTTLFQAYFPWYLIVGALLFSFIVGTVSGLVPAIQAARKKPVDALRYE